MMGIYTDEISSGQNTLIENKIQKAQVPKDDPALEKHDTNKLFALIPSCLKLRLNVERWSFP